MTAHYRRSKEREQSFLFQSRFTASQRCVLLLDICAISVLYQFLIFFGTYQVTRPEYMYISSISIV